MNSFFPDDPKKLKTRLRTYERSLSKDNDDSFGKRYFIGPMYLLLDDVDGAIKSFEWFSKTYEDDCGEPYQYLCWTLALYKAKKLPEAIQKFKKTMLRNLYLIPVMLGLSPKQLDIWHGSNFCVLAYAKDIPPELVNLWDEDAKSWALKLWNEESIAAFREHYIDIERQLKDLRPGPERSALVKESSIMKYGPSV